VQVAEALQVNTKGMQERDAALSAVDAIEALMKKVGHPMTLRDIGIKEKPRHEAAFHAISDPVQIFNARPVNNLGDVITLFKQVY
jgi:alcohol dehydrogenase class IV